MHKRILVVDDDPHICHVYVETLEDFDVQTFQDPFKALGVILGRGTDCDLLIIDLVLPGMDGATFTRVIRAVEAELQKPHRRKIILSTGYHPDLVGVEALTKNVDCDDFLPKPFDLKALTELLCKHCE